MLYQRQTIGLSVKRIPTLGDRNWKPFFSYTKVGNRIVSPNVETNNHIRSGLCDKKGMFLHEELFRLPELAFCQLLQFVVLNELKSRSIDSLDFESFVRILNAFSPKESPLKKLECKSID